MIMSGVDDLEHTISLCVQCLANTLVYCNDNEQHRYIGYKLLRSKVSSMHFFLI